MRGAFLVIIIALELHGFAGTPRASDSFMKNIFLSGRRCAALAFGVVGFFGIHFGHARAATINAASPSLVDVTTAIASAADGDTVIVPAGTASWTSGLIITKGITLMGQTTTDVVAKTASDQTIILDDIPRVGNYTAIISIPTVVGKTTRVSGFTFRVGAVTDTSYRGVFNVTGAVSMTSNPNSFRIDHCHFDDVYHQNDDIYAAVFGVIDHNLVDCRNSITTQFCLVSMPDWGGHSNIYGDYSFADATNFGGATFVFIEDNCLNNASGQEYNGTMDCQTGGRYVARNNHLYDCNFINSHGDETVRYRGTRAIESYNNDFHWLHSTNVGGIRSGCFLTHDNTHDGSVPASGPGLTTYRIFAAVPPWGGSSGDNVWDVNATEADGTHVDGHPPYLFESGTATSGSGTTIVDTTKTWATNQWVGYQVRRVSDSGIAAILSNTATALTVTYDSSHYGIVWTAGDAYQIHKVLISMDQACRGISDLITGGAVSPVNSTSGTATWTHQALEPAYSWNDIYNPGAVPVLLHVPTNFGAQSILVENRDYFNGTPMPGYTPYTYPHPLVSGGGHGPQTPGDLHVTQ
jgi:hypothetical protein